MANNITDLAFFKQNSFGDPVLYKELLDIFVKTTPEMLEQIKVTADAGNFIQLSKVAHKLKSNVQSVGLNEVYRMLDQLEYIETTPISIDELDGLVLKIVQLCNIAVSEVKTELKKP